MCAKEILVGMWNEMNIVGRIFLFPVMIICFPILWMVCRCFREP